MAELNDYRQDDKIKIYIATHRPFEFPDDASYVPIHVGKAGSSDELGLIGDDTGDNISRLNRNFCELTALYWIWKNVDVECVGLVHYRRHFEGIDHTLTFKDKRIAAPRDFGQIGETLDIMVAKPLRLYWNNGAPQSVEMQYVFWCHAHDLVILRRKMREIHPEYLEAYDFVMRNNVMSSCNMFVARKNTADEYCDWLFKLLFKLKEGLPIEHYDQYQRRVFGFLAERLFNVWLAHNRDRLRVDYREIVDF